MAKKLQPDSKFASADINNDGVCTDEELNAQLDREERRIRMDNNDKKDDMIRYLITFQSASVTLFVGVLIFPEFVPESRLDHLVGIASTFIISQLGIIGSYIGVSAWSKSKENK